MQPVWLRPRGDCSFEYATVTDEVLPPALAVGPATSRDVRCELHLVGRGAYGRLRLSH
jgi:hypothetical protein